MNRVLWLAVLFCVSSSASLACSNPPPETISLTWPPSTTVSVHTDSQVNSFNAVANAVNNWNNGSIAYCYAPLFTFGAGTGPTMSVSYGPIPNDPNGNVRRGLTVINSSGRITSAQVTINSNIPLTFPSEMTEVMAHEIGHTMGLNDCVYSPSCLSIQP